MKANTNTRLVMVSTVVMFALFASAFAMNQGFTNKPYQTAMAQNAVTKHIGVLTNVSSTLPAQAQNGINNALNNSAKKVIPSATGCTIYLSGSLSNDVVTNCNIIINASTTLNANGHSIITSGTFTDNGVINTGYANNGGAAGGVNSGSGGESAYGIYIQAYSIDVSNGVINANGQAGGNGAGYIGASGSVYCDSGGTGGGTLAVGGAEGSGAPTSGSSPSAPQVSNLNIMIWYNNGFQNYLESGSGGGGAYAGTNTNGGSGASFTDSYAGSGGGGGGSCFPNFDGGGGSGGGVIFLAYGPGGYLPGTYNVSGAPGGTSQPCFQCNNGYSGGNGQIVTYQWSVQPLPGRLPTFTSTCANLQSGTCTGDIVYTTATTLTGDVSASGNITVDSGVELTTDGAILIAGENFSNFGVLNAGNANDGGAAAISGVDGSGGGSSYGIYIQAANIVGGTINAMGQDGASGISNGSPGGSGHCPAPGAGGSTLIAGGSNDGPGSTPTAPVLSNSNIQLWNSNGFQNYLESGSGGGGADSASGANGGAGSSFPSSYAGSGASGSHTCSQTHDSGGGAGGGVIMLAYGSSYLPGTYNVNGGGITVNNTYGGTDTGGGLGGTGQVATFKWATPPIAP